MGDFATYLAESTKQYDYRIKVAGDIDKDFGTKLEQELQKFEVAKMSAGKSTPIQETPLDFPMFKNTNVTIYELVTNYPASVFEMAEYIANYMGLARNQVVVRKPGEPTEEYQDNMTMKKSEYASKLLDLEYKDLSKITDTAELHGTKANMSLLKELLKDRQSTYEVEKGSDNKVQDTQSNEEQSTPSPFTKSTNPHPDPKRK